jgi:hypothetical protein
MPRYRFEFWLDSDKAQDHEIAQIISDLKARREYVAAIRDGLRLITDLQGNRLDILLTMYPWITDRLCNPDGGASTEALQALNRKLDALLSPGAAPATRTTTPGQPIAHQEQPKTVAELEVKQVTVDLDVLGDDFLDFIT